jgi:hypothetical protein
MYPVVAEEVIGFAGVLDEKGVRRAEAALQI